MTALSVNKEKELQARHNIINAVYRSKWMWKMARNIHPKIETQEIVHWAVMAMYEMNFETLTTLFQNKWHLRYYMARVLYYWDKNKRSTIYKQVFKDHRITSAFLVEKHPDYQPDYEILTDEQIMKVCFVKAYNEPTEKAFRMSDKESREILDEYLSGKSMLEISKERKKNYRKIMTVIDGFKTRARRHYDRLNR